MKDKDRKLDKINQIIHCLPETPGCYLFKNKSGIILYIGKAKNIKKRVLSYFGKKHSNPKTEVLVSQITDLDFYSTNSETEAYVLENNLIKKHYPKYNIRLVDDSSYPYIVIDLFEEFPRLKYMRHPKKIKERLIFGPFTIGSNISEILKLLTKLFQLRDCSIREFNSRKEPCILFQIKHCSAPCVNYIKKEDYFKNLQQVMSILKGEGKKTLKALKEEMRKASEAEFYERAAYLRDGIFELERFIEKSIQKNVEISRSEDNVDYIGILMGKKYIDLCIYQYRDGKLINKVNQYFPKEEIFQEIKEELLSLVFSHYQNKKNNRPELVKINLEKNDLELLNNLFSEIIFKLPEKNSPHDIVIQHLISLQSIREGQSTGRIQSLFRLGKLLDLKERPIICECFDVAIWQGDSPTGSCVVFKNGAPLKKEYRYYYLNERPEGNNDFAMMKELIERRYSKESICDVIIVDGGKGQVSSALQALRELDISIPVIGIAKKRAKKRDRLYLPVKGIWIEGESFGSLISLVGKMRDEAHSFSRKLHHKGEKNRVFSSFFKEIEGVGPKTLEKILVNLDCSLEHLKSMSDNELAIKLNINTNLSKKIKAKLTSL